MSSPNLLIETADRIRTITVNRPDKLNALNHDTLSEIDAAFHEAFQAAEVGVLILTGAGPKAFIAGADIGELKEQNALSGFQLSLFGQAVTRTIARSPKPVIAAVNGFALGGGCEIALACHMRIVAENARFGQPEVNLGAIPGYGGTQRLARIVGLGRAAEMILTGGMIDAQEAYRIGLANKVVPPGEAVRAARELAAVILTKSPVAVELALEALRAVQETGLDEGLAIEAALFGLGCGSDDFHEGTAAFLEKRPAKFQGT